MEIFKHPIGRVVDLQWMEPATVVFAYCWDGYIHGVRRTHPEEEPDSYLVSQANRLTREHQAARRKNKNRLRESP